MATVKKPTLLRFELTIEDPRDAFEIFFPNGQYVLNRTTWRNKEPRSCAVTRLRSRNRFAWDEGPIVFDVEVSYRPQGYITFAGDTKYDGWTAMMLSRKGGALLDEDGNPLAPGKPPVYLPLEVYEDVEFNEIEFGTFIEEVEVAGIRHITREEAMELFQSSVRLSASMRSSFFAPRRQRPQVRIAIADAPLTPVDRCPDMRMLVVDKSAPHFRQNLVEQLYEAVSGFVEGRYSLNSLSTESTTFVDLSGCLVELKPIPGEQRIESVFNVFSYYVSSADLEEIAKRLVSVYAVSATVVDGKEAGFVFERLTEGR